MIKKPGHAKQKAKGNCIDHFLERLTDDSGKSGEENNYNPVEELIKQFDEILLNQVKLTKA